MACTTSKPTLRMRRILNEIFPGQSAGSLTLHAGIKCNGGEASQNDVVSFRADGQLQVGELLCNVGVACPTTGDPILFSMLSVWTQLPTPVVDQPFEDTAVFEMSDTRIAKVHSECLDTVFTCHKAADGNICTVCLPWELRRLSQALHLR
jgi:hypothetical protein